MVSASHSSLVRVPQGPSSPPSTACRTDKEKHKLGTVVLVIFLVCHWPKRRTIKTKRAQSEGPIVDGAVTHTLSRKAIILQVGNGKNTLTPLNITKFQVRNNEHYHRYLSYLSTESQRRKKRDRATEIQSLTHRNLEYTDSSRRTVLSNCICLHNNKISNIVHIVMKREQWETDHFTRCCRFISRVLSAPQCHHASN
jgi:hypothetical protein